MPSNIGRAPDMRFHGEKSKYVTQDFKILLSKSYSPLHAQFSSSLN